MKKTVVIVDDEPITRMDLKEMLDDAGYHVIGEACDGFDAIEICTQQKPDLVIMDIKMPLLNGLKASRVLINDNLAKCILLLTAYSDKDMLTEAKDIGIMSYIVKPVDERSLLPAIEIAIAKQDQINGMKEEIDQMKRQLEDRKKIEKAKGILMVQNEITEEEAYNMLRKLSMDKRCSMGKIADTINLNH